jgi:hypothetical protein
MQKDNVQADEPKVQEKPLTPYQIMDALNDSLSENQWVSNYDETFVYVRDCSDGLMYRFAYTLDTDSLVATFDLELIGIV